MIALIKFVKHPRQREANKSKSPALRGCPQKRAIVIKSFDTTPRKPNSAKRRVAKVRLSNKLRLNVYLEGESINKLNPHSVILVRGRGPRDLPGVRYHAIRGVKDFIRLETRRNGRSKYGTRRSKLSVEAEMLIIKRTTDQKKRFLIYNIHYNGFGAGRYYY